MADKFDPYREALVVEMETVWPDEYDDLDEAQKLRMSVLLHQDAESASHLEYVRVHTGFCRKITVTPEDVQRLAS